MGRGLRLGAALTVSLVLLLQVVQAEPSPDPEAGERIFRQWVRDRLANAAKALNLALDVWQNGTNQSQWLATPPASGLGPGGLRHAATGGLEQRSLVAEMLSALFPPPPPSEVQPLPPWLAPLAASPLVVLGALLLFRRPVASLRVSGSLFPVAVARGPPPPVLPPLLRLVSMGLMGLALVLVHLFQPLLLASTGLLLVSLALGPA